MVTTPVPGVQRPDKTMLEWTSFFEQYQAPDVGAGLCLGARKLEKRPPLHTRVTVRREARVTGWRGWHGLRG